MKKEFYNLLSPILSYSLSAIYNYIILLLAAEVVYYATYTHSCMHRSLFKAITGIEL